MSSQGVPLHASPLESVQAVGAFSEQLRTTLTPPKAGATALLDIALVPDMQIAAGESIRFTLRGFTVPGGNALLPGEAVVSAPLRALESLGWDANTSTLELVFRADVAAKTRVAVRVDALGLVVPPDGVRRAPGYEISTDARAGRVVGVRLASFAPIGALRAPTLAYSNPRAGYTTAITISFTPTMALTPGFALVLALPGFTADRQALGAGEWSVAPAGAFASVVWNGTAGKLRLAIGASLSPLTDIRVEVALGAGFMLPLAGLEANDARLTFESDTLDGPIVPTPFAVSPELAPAGNITFSALSFNASGKAGDATALLFSLTCPMPLSNVYPKP